jgi:hypothetical protein
MDRQSALWKLALVLGLTALTGVSAVAQTASSATLSQTVNQRHTIGVLTASPSSGITTSTSVTFTYVLHTAGATAPTSETVQFMDSGSSLGSAQSITSLAGSNLLPWSQVSTANGWTTTGTAPTVTAGAATGPDGSTASATNVVFPSTTSTTSGVAYAVSGTAYASDSMTLSVWAKGSAAVSLTLGLATSAGSSSSSTTCAVTTSWQRCTFTYAFPAGATTGFTASFSTSGQAAATVSLWGAQVEQASSAGPYVSTIGTARASGGVGGSVSYTTTLSAGSHSIDVVYSGDTNFVTSTSNAVSLTATTATPTIALVSSPSGTSVYGSTVTLTATLTGGTAGTPTGTVSFYDSSTLLGTGTLSSGVATLSLSGTSSLAGGSHSLTAVYGGDSNYTTVTSSAVSLTVTTASGAVTLTPASSLNPSYYGDSVTISITVASTLGAATPTGTVTVADSVSGTTIGTITLTGGTGSLTISTLTAGSHTLTLTYSGDSNYY